MSPVLTGRPGRPAAATREAALALATDRFLAGERVDVRAIASELGLARATMHRWFGTRASLLGEVLAELAEERLLVIRGRITATGADALLILTEWEEFANLDLLRLNQELKYPIVIDGRNLYDPEIMAEHGFNYYSVGREASHPDGVPAGALRNGTTGV